MGKYMLKFLRTIKVPVIILSKNKLEKQIEEASQILIRMKNQWLLF